MGADQFGGEIAHAILNAFFLLICIKLHRPVKYPGNSGKNMKIFLTYLIINHNYGLGIVFATIWLIAVFYFLKSDITVIRFAIARIFDTLIGTSLGLFSELIFLRKVKNSRLWFFNSNVSFWSLRVLDYCGYLNSLK